MKRPPRWTVPFLRELERTGNVRVAAERAGVDFSTAYQRRKRHGDFAEAWEAALRKFAEAPARPVFTPPAPPPPLLCEEERGLIIRPSQDGSGTLVRAPHALTSSRWSKRAETDFLTELTVSGSVSLAAKAVGFSTTAVYRRRLKDRHFAAAWEAAVDTGKARVHSYLVQAATRTFDPDQLPIADDQAIPKVSISEAISIAKLKNSAGPDAVEVTAVGSGGRAEFRVASDEEVRDALVKRLKAFGARMGDAYAEAGWTLHELASPPGKFGDGVERVWLPPGHRIVGPDGAGAE